MTYEEVLAALDNCYFDELTNDNCEDNIIYNIPMEVDWDKGASKLAIFFPNTDFVVKIPFSGYFDEDEYDDDYWDFEHAENDSEIDEPDLADYYYSFEGACDQGDGSDYCRAEELCYELATEYGVEQLFAKTECIGKVNGYPIYAQPICESFSFSNNSLDNSKEEIALTLSKCKENDFYSFNDEWLTDVLKYYGDEIFNNLCHFIDTENIRDLHNGNIGYRNGAPILFDYSGYES